MQTEIIISGFGGQGTLYAGQLLSYAAMDEGKQVTWIHPMGRKCAVALPIARWSFQTMRSDRLRSSFPRQ